MDVVHPEFRPDPTLDRDEMVDLQRDIARAAGFADDPGADLARTCDPDGDALVAGVDQAFDGDEAVSAVVVIEDGDVVERASARVETEIPYVPGLLAFREAPSVVAALESLDRDPDVVMFDGSGRIHYRQAGLATHLGVLLDVPAVGVIKNLLCGHPRASLDRKLPAGARVPIGPDDEVEGPTDGPIGYALQTRQFEGEGRHVNPVFVSAGHRVSASTAADLVAAWCDGYKLPEPIRLADRAAAELSD
jgi:deoxyribonuclease V